MRTGNAELLDCPFGEMVGYSSMRSKSTRRMRYHPGRLRRQPPVAPLRFKQMDFAETA